MKLEIIKETLLLPNPCKIKSTQIIDAARKDKKIDEIKKRNKIPIIVGGTGLYFKALTDGLVKIFLLLE